MERTLARANPQQLLKPLHIIAGHMSPLRLGGQRQKYRSRTSKERETAAIIRLLRHGLLEKFIEQALLAGRLHIPQ